MNDLVNQIIENAKAIFWKPEEAENKTNVELAEKLQEVADQKASDTAAFETVMTSLAEKINASITASNDTLGIKLEEITKENARLKTSLEAQAKQIESLKSENAKNISDLKTEFGNEINTIKGQAEVKEIDGEPKLIEGKQKSTKFTGTMSIKDLRNTAN